MSDLTLSLMGIYNQDPTILDADHLHLPAEMDRDVLIPMALSESAELEVVYPEPNTLKIVMSAWSSARLPSWQRMLDALADEYNPLHNYDRTEIESGTNTGNDTNTETENIEDGLQEDVADSTTGSTSATRSGSSETKRTGAETTEEDISDSGSSTTSGTSTGQVTGFNAQTFADNDKTISSGSGTTSGSRDRDQTVTTAGTDNTSSQDTETGATNSTAIRDRDQSYSRDRTVTRNGRTDESHARTLRAYGNIGVTTSQEMLRAELEIRILDVYRLVVDELISYFCLRIY